MERKLRIYVETSVISHLDAPDRPDRMGETLRLWKEIDAGKYEVVIGNPVLLELERCHEPKRSFMMDELQKLQYDLVLETDASKQLAAEYINVGGLPVCLEGKEMNKFGLEEIRTIRDRWDAMPYEEAKAEREESFLRIMKQMYGENWKTKIHVITSSGTMP